MTEKDHMCNHYNEEIHAGPFLAVQLVGFSSSCRHIMAKCSALVPGTVTTWHLMMWCYFLVFLRGVFTVVLHSPVPSPMEALLWRRRKKQVRSHQHILCNKEGTCGKSCTPPWCSAQSMWPSGSTNISAGTNVPPWTLEIGEMYSPSSELILLPAKAAASVANAIANDLMIFAGPSLTKKPM